MLGRIHYIQFFTATILWWKKLLKPDKYKQMNVESMSFLVKDRRVKIHGFVIMPNHIHIVWRIHENGVLKDDQRDFLKYTAQQIRFDLQKHHPQVLSALEVNLKDRQYQFWERPPPECRSMGRKGGRAEADTDGVPLYSQQSLAGKIGIWPCIQRTTGTPPTASIMVARIILAF